MQDYEIIRRKFLIEKKSQSQITKKMKIYRNTVAKYVNIQVAQLFH
ncbi:DNA-binding transcriptional regulator LsrR (DeoR family) [Pectinatus brassicae]|uniref:DNA-binding transcriptional regulator LsrR (DeoR family) n=1 Tax=Pectinatus brassicae TaxID=862415 RepID=A0A840UXJ5_9FIRM|nr:DNA-binding transcriptional regulator LsrR (DeoR family) [Pectinatus brassicae]